MRKVLLGAIVVVNLLFVGWLAAGLSGPVYVWGCEALTGTAEARCMSGDPDYVVGCNSLGATSSEAYERCADHGVPVHNYPGSVPVAAVVFLWIIASVVLLGWSQSPRREARGWWHIPTPIRS